MICAPNTYRQGVVGGFVIEPPAIGAAAYFTPNSTWISIGLAAGGFLPAVGDEVELLLDDAYSGLPLIAGTAFNYRGPWAASTAYSAGDAFVWYNSAGLLETWLVLTGFTSAGSGFGVDPTSVDIRALNFRGVYESGVAYTQGDLVLAPDIHGYTQTWVALSSFTSSGAFSAGSQWGGCLAAETVFYVVGVNAGQIQIATTQNGAPLTFMSGSFFLTPDAGAQITAYFGTTGFGAGSGLTPALTIGALYANGSWWIPATPPACPAAPTSQFSYLAYNSGSGLYWTTNAAGTTAGDAVLGWVLTNATDIIVASCQNILVGNNNLGSGNLPGLIPFAINTVPTPTGGIASAGNGLVTFDPITFASGVDTSQINAATIVLLYQDAIAGATAHLTAALASGVASGTAATLSLDTDLTGIAEAGDWILIGGEMLYVTANATSGGVAVDRALGLTTSEANGIGTPIYLLQQIVYPYSFPVGFFAGATAMSWGATEQLPNANIALFNIVVWSDTGAESAASPINYSQAMGGLIATGAPSSVGFLAAVHAAITGGAAQANLGVARSVTVGPLTAHTTIAAVNTTGSAPFLWTLTIQQDSTGGRAMIPGNGLNFALSTVASPANSKVTGLIFYDGAGNHLLLASTGDMT